MTKILIDMKKSEFAEICAERICNFYYHKIPKEKEAMLADIIEYDIKKFKKLSSIIDYTDNFVLDWAECQFDCKEIAEYIINELKIDLKDIVDFLNLQIEDVEFNDLSKTQTTLTDLWFIEFKRYLIKNKDFNKLNYFIQEKMQDKGRFTIIYSENGGVCSYRRYN